MKPLANRITARWGSRPYAHILIPDIERWIETALALEPEAGSLSAYQVANLKCAVIAGIMRGSVLCSSPTIESRSAL